MHRVTYSISVRYVADNPVSVHELSVNNLTKIIFIFATGGAQEDHGAVMTAQNSSHKSAKILN